MITVYLAEECGARYAGPYAGDVFGGSFVTYICDRHTGHKYPRGHTDSTCGFTWSDDVDAPALALVGSNPTGELAR